MDTAQQLVIDLHSAGFSEEKIASMAGSTQPTINRIRNGVSKSCDSDLYRALYMLRRKYSRRVRKAA